MPPFFPRRFTNPEFLKTIAPENLFAFLAPSAPIWPRWD